MVVSDGLLLKDIVFFTSFVLVLFVASVGVSAIEFGILELK